MYVFAYHTCTYILNILQANLGQMLLCMGGASSFISWQVWYQRPYPQLAKVAGGSAGLRQHNQPCSRGYFILHLAWWADLSHQTQEPKCSRVPYHTLQSSATARAGLCCQKPTKQNVKRCQRCETEELGVLCTEAIIVSHLLVLILWQLSCLFSLTLYSSSILLNASSDKRERDFFNRPQEWSTQVPPESH